MRSLRTLAAATAAASAFAAPQTKVDAAVSKFLRAFENLDLEAFTACFAEDATVFFPAPEPAERFEGKAAIRAHFQLVFEAIRKQSGAASPPYHHLDPEGLQVRMLGPDAALVSFQLRNRERLARRSLVLRRSGGTWLIVHLHASNLPLTEPS